MADLLPSTPDTSAAEEADPRVVGVDSDDADDLIGALSSDTARGLLAALHDEPANPAKLADAVDTTIQNAQYHLEKLEDAGLIEVVDTVYSEKGREMNVYAPSDRPLVVVAGREEETSGLKTALSRLLGALGVLGLSSLLVEQVLGDGLVPFTAGSGAAPEGGESGDDLAAGTNATATEDATATATEGGMSVAENGGGNETATATAQPQATGEPTGTPAATGTPAPEADTPVPTEAADTATRTAAELVEQSSTDVAYAVESSAGLPPGLLFFAGGATVLALGFAVWYVRQ